MIDDGTRLAGDFLGAFSISEPNGGWAAGKRIAKESTCASEVIKEDGKHSRACGRQVNRLPLRTVNGDFHEEARKLRRLESTRGAASRATLIDRLDRVEASTKERTIFETRLARVSRLHGSTTFRRFVSHVIRH